MFGSNQDALEIVFKKQETLGLNLVFESLSARIVRHGRSNGRDPCHDPGAGDSCGVHVLVFFKIGKEMVRGRGTSWLLVERDEPPRQEHVTAFLFCNSIFLHVNSYRFHASIQYSEMRIWWD